MEEKCDLLSEGDTLSLVTSGHGEDKDSVIYVIPLFGNENLFQSNCPNSSDQIEDPTSLFVNLDEAALAQLSSQQNEQQKPNHHIPQFTQPISHLVPERKVVVIDEAQAQRDIEEKDQERARLAEEAICKFTDSRRKKRVDKSSTKLPENDNIESENEEDMKNTTGIFKCPVCDAVFSRSNSFYGHLQTHSGKGTIFQCSDCSREFESLAKLWKHERIHTNFRPFVCQQCPMTFERQSQLTYHTQRIHEQKRPFSCDACSKSFHKNSDLRQHMLVHAGTNQHVCPDCGKGFNHVSNLNRHLRIHTKEKPYVCVECHQRFKQLSSLNAHSATHGPIGRRSGRSKSENTCPECNLVFKSHGVFKAHLQSEHLRSANTQPRTLGKKSFHCRVCGLKFSFAAQLKEHSFSHEGPNQQFPCRACNRSFKMVDLLLKHKCRKRAKDDADKSNQRDVEVADQDVPETSVPENENCSELVAENPTEITSNLEEIGVGVNQYTDTCLKSASTMADIKEESTIQNDEKSSIGKVVENISLEKMIEKLTPIDVLHFDRTVRKKCRFPTNRENLVAIQQAKVEEKQIDSVEKFVENLPRNFCKKDFKTGIQKQFECQACQCLMESLQALTAHVQGEKHAKAILEFVPSSAEPVKREKPTAKEISDEQNSIKIHLTLEQKMKDSQNLPVIGLKFVQEFVSTEIPSAYRMYKCGLFDCDGAWGTSYEFSFHLLDRKHYESYATEVLKMKLRDVTALKDSELQEKMLEHSNPDFGQIETIHDQERWAIQKTRLASRPMARISRKRKNKESNGDLINYAGMGNGAGSTGMAALASAALAGAKRKLDDCDPMKTDVKKAKLETKALKAKRPGFTDERYNETSYYHDPETNLRKVYPYYFTFTTFTKGRWVGERILDVFAREFRAHPAEEYERCIKAGTLTVNYEKVDIDYRLKHNDLLANVVHRHEVPVSSEKIRLIHMDDDLVVVNKPASIPVHPCGRYRHNTVVFILAKEYGLKNLRTIHRLDRLTSGLLLFGRNPKKAREMEQQIRTRQVQKEYVCRVEGEFPENPVCCKEPIEVVSYKIGVCKVSSNGKDCHTEFQRLSFNGRTSVVLCRPRTGRMHQIRVHLQYLGYPVVNDPLYNHSVFGPEKGKGGRIGKSDEQLIQDLITIHNAENWLGLDEEGGGMGGPCDNVLLSGPPTMSPVSKTNASTAKHGRSDSPDSAVDVHSASADSPSSSTTSDFHGDSSSNVGYVAPNNAGYAVSTNAVYAASNSVGFGTLNNVGVRSNMSMEDQDKVTTATQTGIEEADMNFDERKLSLDTHCYECKVKYRDPRPKDLVMFLHAWTYSGPDWKFVTELPTWAQPSWVDPPDYLD